MPKVSVIVPNYNHARFLEQRLQSVIDQTFEDFELVFLDDASTDESRQVFERFSHDPRVRAVFNPTNSGSVFKQWNRGFAEAAGDYIWIAESDDYSDERFLETLVRALDTHPSAGIAYCQSWAVNENGCKMKIMELQRAQIDEHRWKSDFFNNGRDECARYFVQSCMINNASSALVRRSVVQKIGGADENWRIAGDWVFWAKMLMESDIVFVAQPLNYWRCHSATVRSSATRSGEMLEESYRVAKMIADLADVPPDILERSRALWFLRWVRYNEQCRFSLNQHRAIYEAARRFDPHIKRRIALYLPIAPLRIAAKAVRAAVRRNDARG